MNKTVVVLGLRSGTSLVMQILESMGATVNKQKPASIYNKYGFFEDFRLKEENDDLLISMGKTTPYFTVTLEELKTISEERVEELRKFYTSIKTDFLALKNPQLTWTLPIWDRVFDDPIYIFCDRNIKKQRLSLMRMASFDSILMPKGWLENYRKTLEIFLANKDHLTIDYDFLIDCPKDAIESIANFVDTKPDIEKALSLIDKTERHF